MLKDKLKTFLHSRADIIKNQLTNKEELSILIVGLTIISIVYLVYKTMFQ